MIVSVFKNVFSNPWYLPLRIAQMVPRIVPSSLYLRLLYKFQLGRWPDLTHPKRFTEKLQWLKLHDRNPLYTTLVDKIAVKEYIAEKIGPERVFKTLGVWNHAENIDIDSLPDQFVLKCNHYGGGEVFICKDRTRFDFQKAKRGLTRQLREGIYWRTREWPYLQIKPTIFAEEYMEDDSGSLRDYKFYCVHGVPKFVLVVRDRYTNHYYDGYDMEFNPIGKVSRKASACVEPMRKPEAFDEMVSIARRLSKGFLFVRIDLYEIKGKVYFGEYTFYPASGLNNRDSDQWDLQFGGDLDICKLNVKC